MDILSKICSLLGYSFGILWTFQQHSEYLSIICTKGYSKDDLIRFTKLDLDNNLVNSNCNPILSFIKKIPTFGTCKDDNYIEFNTEVLETVSFPIIEKNKSIGVLTFERKLDDKTFDALRNNLNVFKEVLSNIFKLNILQKYFLIQSFQLFIKESEDFDLDLKLDRGIKWIQEKLEVDFCAFYQRTKKNEIIVSHAYEHGKNISKVFDGTRYFYNEDLIGWVACNKQPISLFCPTNINSAEYIWYEKKYNSSPMWKNRSGRKISCCITAIPIFEQDRLFGVLRVSSYYDETASGNKLINITEENLLIELGEILSNSLTYLKIKKLHETLFAEEWSITNDIGFNELIKKTNQLILTTTNATNCFLIFKDILREDFHAYIVNEDLHPILVNTPFDEDTIFSEILRSKHSLKKSFTENSSIELFKGHIEKNINSLIAIPLLVRKQLNEISSYESIGALICTSFISNAFNDSDEWFLTSISEKVTDSYQVIEASTIINSTHTKENNWQHAVLSGSLASSQSHESRKILNKVIIPKFNQLTRIDKIKQDRELFNKVNEIDQTLRELKEKMDYLQRYFLTSEGKFEKISLNKLVQEVIDGLINEIQSSHAKINIESSEDISAEVDKIQMKIVLINLITNSLEARANKILIRISTLIDNMDEKSVILSISDNGIGIPEDFREIIFNEFESRRKKETGSGLGLWVCKEIITKLFYGNIVLKESVPREKTTFLIDFPIEQ